MKSSERFGLYVILFLPILPVRDVLQLAGVAPAADDAVGGAWVDAEGGFGVGLAVELWRDGFEELALLEGGSCGGGRGGGLSRVGFREGEEDVGVVVEDHGGHRHRTLIVGVEADQSVLDDAVLHYAEGGEDHRETERYQAEAADGGNELVSAAVAVLGLPGGEPFVEIGCLRGREGETDVTGLFEDGVEVVELLTKCGIREDARWAELGSKGMNRLVNTLINDEYQIRGKSRFKEEFVTCGGVALYNINLNTLESKNHPGLYFAGEVLDVDAITGGFNLQAAWSMGYTVARSITLHQES